MAELKFYELKCQRCGGELEQLSGGIYRCKSCGKAFKEQLVEDVADKLRNVLNEQKQEAIANLRQQLWTEMHEQYINSNKIVGLARDIKKYLPDDYFANFCEVANSGNDRQVSSFLNNTSKADMADYADVVLDFMLKSVTAGNLNAISLFIERAFNGDPVSYDKYVTAYEREAQKVNSGIYELIITRHVFLAYSSKDIEKVLELCDYLERNKITCFLALRNLRHGRGAVDNYDQALKTAIDNCKTVVFVSSTNSRDTACDALMRELPYIKQKDIEAAPAEYRRAYDRMPAEYMMPRVEYLIEDYSGGVAEMITKEFFHGLEWCKNKEDVASRILKYISEEHETAAQKAEREKRQFQQQLEEERRKTEEERRKAKELELKIAEVQRIADEKRAEAERAKIEAEERLARTRIEAEQHAKEQSGNESAIAEAKEDPDAKYCKSCRTPNKYTAKVCTKCGSRVFFANFDEYLASKVKFCALCGEQNDAEAKFCANCGSTEFVPTKKAYDEYNRKKEAERKVEEERKANALKALLNIGDYKDIGGGYITFGSYPQRKKAKDVQIGEIFDKDNGYYLGSDYNLYVEYNGKYYKVEPIKWKVLQNGSEKLIVADDILDAHRFAKSSNNYANSEVRQFINGDFYTKAFNDSQRIKIVTTTVDNSLWSTGDSKNQYICNNTSDKVFLLSYKEADQYFNDDEDRKRVPTEYAEARGAWQSDSSKRDGKDCGYWWLRSPDSGGGDYAQRVDSGGDLDWIGVGLDYYGVVPAIRISLLTDEERKHRKAEEERRRIEEERKRKEEEERLRKLREEQERLRKAEEERQRKQREEEERKRKEEENRLRKLREEQERLRKVEEERKHKEAEERKRLEEEERQRKIREEEERKRLEEEERLRKIREEAEERQHKIREEEEQKYNEEKKRKEEERKQNKEALFNSGDYRDIGGGYVTFGTYPQSLKADDIEIWERIDEEHDYYLGSDCCFYAFCKGKYYKVEPIKWKVLQSGSEMIIVADDILDAHRFAEKKNNYENSEIRQFLNSEFFNKAFNNSQRCKILTTAVDNSLVSTGDKKNKFICNNTSDNVFLLSNKEAIQYFSNDEDRKRVPTEYAVAKGALQDSSSTRNGKGCGYWWLRSPYSDRKNHAQYVFDNGHLSGGIIDYDRSGVVPALKFKPEIDKRR